jgi:hypothetical protein
MTDFDLKDQQAQGNSPQFRGREQTKDPSRSMKEQMGDAGAKAKKRVDDTFRATSDVTGDKLGEAADAAMGVASNAVDQVQEKAREQQHAGADFVRRLAEDMRTAGRAFEADVPFAARGIDTAANYVEDAAEKIRTGSLSDLVDGATNFAKRQPTAFLGIAVLAGFAAVRFLKASGEATADASESRTSTVAPASFDSTGTSGSFEMRGNRP